MVELIIEIEHTFSILITDEEMGRIELVVDLWNMIVSKIEE